MILTDLPERNLEQFGEYPFLYFEDKEYSNVELVDNANRLANLLSGRGVGKGDRVLVCMPNRPEVFVSYQGVLRTGAIVIPVMYLLHPSEIRYIVENSEAKAIITSSAVLPGILKATEGLDAKPFIVVADGAGELPGVPGQEVLALYEELSRMPAQKPDLQLESDDLAVILYTSGTTGRPKGVMLTHRNLYSNAEGAASMMEDDERGTTLGVLPLAHIYGFTASNVLYLRGGAMVVFPKYELEGVCRAIEQHKVKRFAAVPAMIHNMVVDPRTENYDLSSLESVGSGSAPLPVKVIEAFHQKFGAEIHEGYGLSEAAPAVAVHRRGEPIKPGSVGRAYPGVEIKIIDDQGLELPTGEVGELVVRGENVTPGYYRNEEATAAALRDGWLHTGDVARIDEDGYLYIVDRKKDLIIRGGFNIYPRDLEEVISKHPQVAEVAVIGVPSAEMGEEVVAFIVKKSDATLSEEELIGYCQENLAKYKTPRKVVFVDELPRSGVGKILKKELRQQADEMHLFEPA